MPTAHVVAIDTSGPALAIAQRNADRHGVSDRITFRHGDLLDGVDGPFDLVLANPPYMPAGDALLLQPEVVRFEPHVALFGGDDGLTVIRRLLQDAPRVLAPAGRLILEFGMGQHDAVARLAESAGWDVLRIREDLQRIPRTAVLVRGNTHG